MARKNTSSDEVELSSLCFDDGELIIFDPKNEDAWIQSRSRIELVEHA